jgi:hypothetical protein
MAMCEPAVVESSGARRQNARSRKMRIKDAI